MKKSVIEFKKFLKQYSWLFIAHHPICERFQGHTITIGNVRICKGCFFGYISCLFLVASGVSVLNYGYLQYLILMSICIAISFVKTQNRIWSLATKTILGLALGSGILSILNLSGLLPKILLFYVLANLGLSYFVIRYFRRSKICLNCSYADKMPFCPGLTKPEVKR